MTIGERIKQRRIDLDLTADDLAERAGKSRATIYRYENGDIENLPTTVLEPLAEALYTTPAFLMGWTDDPHDWEKIGNEEGIYPPEGYEGSYEDYVKYKMYEQQDALIDKYYDAHPYDDINEPTPVSAELINYVNMLNDRGKEKVTDYAKDLSMNPVYQNTALLNAAHERTDVEVTDEMRERDDDIMNDDSEWE